jgi:hypothetical protein
MVANDKRRLGIDATINFNLTPGTYAAPAWTTSLLVEELTCDEGWAQGSGNARGFNVEASAKTRGQCTITGRVLCRDNDPVYKAMLAAFRSRDAELDVMVLSGALTSEGATGPRGKFQLHRFSPSLGPNDVIYRDFTLMPAIVSAAEPFVVATVVGGLLVYSAVFGPTDA